MADIGDHLAVVEVGENQITKAGNRLRVDYETFNQPTQWLLECNPPYAVMYPAGYLHMMPLSDSGSFDTVNDIYQIQDFGNQQVILGTNAPNADLLDGCQVGSRLDWVRLSRQSTDYPFSIRWNYENAYGKTAWSAVRTIAFDPDDTGIFTPSAALEWSQIPDQITPNMTFAVNIQANQQANFPYFSLWLYNSKDPNAHHIRLAESGGGAPGCYQALSPPSSFDIPVDLLALNVQPGDQLFLKAKVVWNQIDICPGDDFLDNFNDTTAGKPYFEAVSSGVSGVLGVPNSLDSFMYSGQATVDSRDGTVAFHFEERHSGDDVATGLRWRWVLDEGEGNRNLSRRVGQIA